MHDDYLEKWQEKHLKKKKIFISRISFDLKKNSKNKGNRARAFFAEKPQGENQYAVFLFSSNKKKKIHQLHFFSTVKINNY